ncbi:hypothetical protein [Paenarthrobacter sp. NPDC089316]|uniref:hypothetical protein n=1 Tax=Paenarthrobacter sp. NPDC089316 TaxID=3154974 RepID=UPI00343C4DCA
MTVVSLEYTTMIETTRLEAPTSLARTEPTTRTPLRAAVVQHRCLVFPPMPAQADA